MSAAASGLFDLSGRSALVLGASRGIGRAIAVGLASAGARVAVAARGKADLEECAAAMRQDGRTAEAIVFDALDLNALPALVDDVARRLEGLDVLVHVAGLNRRRPAVDTTVDDWDTVLDLNLRSFFFAAQAVGRHWITTSRFALDRERKGKIIGIGSLTTKIALASMAPYAASKSGLLGVVRTLALEWAQHGICVNAIVPGYIATDFTRAVQDDPARSEWVVSRIPMGRWGTPSDLVGASVFLAARASDYVTGQSLVVDGGWLAA